MAALAASLGAIRCVAGVPASPVAPAVACATGRVRLTSGSLDASTLAADGVAARGGASIRTSTRAVAASLPLATGICPLTIDAAVITASTVSFAASTDFPSTSACAVATAALALAGRGTAISPDARGVNNAATDSPAIPRTIIGAPAADAVVAVAAVGVAGASGARSTLLGAVAWLAACGVHVALVPGLAVGALAVANIANTASVATIVALAAAIDAAAALATSVAAVFAATRAIDALDAAAVAGAANTANNADFATAADAPACADAFTVVCVFVNVPEHI